MLLMVQFDDGVQLPLKVLRPLHPKECLWIAFQPADIAAFLSYLREAGCDSTLAVHSRKAPSGMWKRETGKCVVPYFKADNSTGYKTFKDEEQWVQDALDFLNEGPRPESSSGHGVYFFSPESVASTAAEDAHSATEDSLSSAGYPQRILTESAEDGQREDTSVHPT